MRSMNHDLTSVVNEMNEMNAQRGCLCCRIRKNKRRKAPPVTIDAKSLGVPVDVKKKPGGTTDESLSLMPELVENNAQEKVIVNELNQMRNQLLLFQDQVKTINQSFKEGDEVVQQLGDETNQYMHAITAALSKAEHVLGRKFAVDQEQRPPETGRELDTRSQLELAKNAGRFLVTDKLR